MPNLNLKDDEIVHEEPMTPRLRRRDEGPHNKSMVMVLYIVLILVVLGGALFFLNNAGIIKLWGPKLTVKRIAPPPPVDTTAMAAKDTAKPEVASLESKKIGSKKGESKKGQAVKEPITKKELPPVQPAGSGEFAVQISSWTDPEKADVHVAQLRDAGLDAYVVKAETKAGTRWSVRVGRYASEQEARTVAAHLGENAETRVIVVRAQ